MRTFELHRIEDETGVSGTGIIAQGIQFDDGSCSLRWLTEHKSTALYEDIRTLERIHGHNGKTKIVYTGAPFERAMSDAQQDACENAPFACVGGLAKRGAMVAPEWITPSEREKYLDGYRAAARLLYGDDWETCSFGWAPALTINAPSELPCLGEDPK